MPKTKKGGQVRFNDKITYTLDRGRCLTEDKARHIYKKEVDKIINVETMKQEIEDDRLTRNRCKEEKENEIEPNLYQMAILNKTSRDNTKTEQMINWSILRDLTKYVDGSSCSDTIPSLNVRPLDYRKHKRLFM